MAIDRPDDAEVPPDDHSARPNRTPQFETRSRQEYYTDLRAAVAQQAQTETQPPAATSEQQANGKPWEEVTGWSRRVWQEYQHKWPPEDRPPPDRSAAPPGSWRGAANHFLVRQPHLGP